MLRTYYQPEETDEGKGMKWWCVTWLTTTEYAATIPMKASQERWVSCGDLTMATIQADSPKEALAKFWVKAYKRLNTNGNKHTAGHGYGKLSHVR